MDSCLVIETTALQGLAELFQRELFELTGWRLPVRRQPPRPGDVAMVLRPLEVELGQEGYCLDIAETVQLQASSDPGLFYGTRTLLQMLRLAMPRFDLPHGKARDYPRYRQRAVMLDAGRRYWHMDYLEQTLRRMAWLKLNMLHLHFSDWNGFRLVSESYPGLASGEAYTRADLHRLQNLAQRYHINLVPEIDLPAHATAITDYAPHLRFHCPAMDCGRWSGGEHGGWMVAVNRPDVRQWLATLLNEFVPFFSGPDFHIGGDEYEFDDHKWACPELVASMRIKGYSEPGDVLVEWINEVNALVKSHGRRMQIWNWWECKGQKTTLEPDRDIIINAWTDSPDWFLERGYQTIAAPESQWYVTPGLTGLASPDYGIVKTDYMYEQWVPIEHPNLLGYKLCVWADRAETETDAWFETHWGGSRAVLAERMWGGPRAVNISAFRARLAEVGEPPD
jgi:hexosaminidase